MTMLTAPKPTAEDAAAALAKMTKVTERMWDADRAYCDIVRSLNRDELRKHAAAQGVTGTHSKTMRELREALGVEG